MFDPMFLVTVVAGLMSGGAFCRAAGATIEIAKLRQAPADEADVVTGIRRLPHGWLSRKPRGDA